MNYIITVSNKRKPEQHPNVILDNTTSVGSRIEWENNKYLVKEIIIVNPDEGFIELKCSNITKAGKPKFVSVSTN